MQSRAQWMSTIPYSCNERAGLHHDATVHLQNDSEDGSNKEASLHSGGDQKIDKVSISRDCA